MIAVVPKEGSDTGRVTLRPCGASPLLEALQAKFGFTPEKIVAAAKEQLALAGET